MLLSIIQLLDSTTGPVVSPIILANPVSQAVVVGGQATFNVVASGGSLTYQWYKNGLAIVGATASSYLTPAAVYSTDNGALFHVIVANGAGSAQSTDATLTVVISPPTPASNPSKLLSGYLTELRRMLHDESAQMFPDDELIEYINAGRSRICQDAKCLRQIVPSITLLANVELLSTNTSLTNYQNRVVEIYGISVYWGLERYKLIQYPFTRLDAMLRQWANYRQRPVAYCRMGTAGLYIAPVPDQDYVSDWDVALLPQPLIDDTSIETISAPFDEPVKYWAAYLAKFKEQALGEAAIFLSEYKRQGLMCARAFMTRVIPDPYAG